MRSFLIIVLMLFSYTDTDVGNMRTFKYFRDYCRPFAEDVKYDLSSHRFTYKAVLRFYFDVIEFELPRKVGPAVVCDIIR